MKKKKILALCISFVLSVGLLAGCGSAGNDAAAEESSASVSSEESEAVTASTSSADGETDAASESSEDVEYKYGSITIPALDGSLCGAPLYIAYEKGFFAEHGFDVTLTAADFETRKIGLNNGTIPLVNGDFQFFASAEQGIDMKVVAGMHKGCIKIVVRQDSDITSPEDLRGKKIAVDEIRYDVSGGKRLAGGRRRIGPAV